MAVAKSRRLEADDSSAPLTAIEDKAPGIDEVPKAVDYKKLFAEEKFMNELVTIMLHPNQDSSEVGVPVSVNGIRAYIIPGKVTKVRRMHLAQLVKARPDTIIHRSDDYFAPEHEQNRMFKQSTSRYNFDVVEDTSQGIAWLKELRSHYLRK